MDSATNKRLLRYALVACFFLASVVALSLASGNVAADTHTWISDTTKNANDATAWDSGSAPETGDNVVFNAAHVGSCTWNLDRSVVVVNSFTMATGYSGTVTQGAVDIGIGAGGFLMQAGTFTAINTQSIYDAGNFTRTGGTWTANRGNLYMTGEGSSFNCYLKLWSLYVQANISVPTSTDTIFNAFSLSEGKTITIAATKSLQIYDGALTTADIRGTITGGGALTLSFANSRDLPDLTNCSITTSYVYIRLVSGSGSSKALTATSDIDFRSQLEISSLHATYTCTLDMSSYHLSCNNMVIKTRGVLKGNASYINVNGNWNSASGGWQHDTSTVNITGSNRTVTLAAGQAFNKLNFVPPSTLYWQWNINIPSGTVYWNVTGLNATRAYDLWIDGALFSHHTSDANGTIAFSHGTWSAHWFQLKEPPLVSGTPMETYTVYFEYTFTASCDQTVTWTLVTSATFLSLTGSEVSGTPLALGVYDVSLMAVSSYGTDYLNWTLTIDKMYRPSIIGDDLTNISVGQPYYSEYTIDQDHIAWTLTTDADWLNLTDGVLSGTPGTEDAGTYHVVITAQNANGADTVSFDITVNDVTTSSNGFSNLAPFIGIAVILTLISMAFAGFGRS